MLQFSRALRTDDGECLFTFAITCVLCWLPMLYFKGECFKILMGSNQKGFINSFTRDRTFPIDLRNLSLTQHRDFFLSYCLGVLLFKMYTLGL